MAMERKAGERVSLGSRQERLRACSEVAAVRMGRNRRSLGD